MSEQRRRSIIFGTLLLVLVCAAAWSYARYASARSLAERELDNARAAAALGDQIRQMQRQHTLRSGQELGDTQMTLLVQEAADAAGVDFDGVVQSIRHDDPRRVNGTPYQQKSSELRLRGITLEQLVRMLHHLETANPGLRATRMNLTDPSEGGPTVWNVEPLVLSYLIYAPPEGRRAAANP